MKTSAFVLFPLMYCVAVQAAPVTGKVTVEKPLVFTDGMVEVRLPEGVGGEISYTLKSLSRDGKWIEKDERGMARDGVLLIQPLGEGLHTAVLKIAGSVEPVMARFLAIAPPKPLTDWEKAAMRERLPQSAGKLLRGQSVTLLAAGDSVTATGDYPQMLAMLLGRAAGNGKVQAVKKAYAGKSIDATVRHWQRDMAGLKEEGRSPDIGLIMYGLNDQIAGVPLEAYLEQYEWVTRRLKEAGADAVYLQPTPHIDVAPWGEADKNYPLRTLGFGVSLSPLANKLKVPVVPTWRALWGTGGDSLESSARSLWPLYPPSYNRQFETLSPEGGNGDTIHPNALGHLQIARAVFETLIGQQSQLPLSVSGTTAWKNGQVISSLRIRNESSGRRQGRLEAVAPTGVGYIVSPVAYDLAPGQSITFPVQWKGAGKPQDLLENPFDRYLLTPRLQVPVMDFSGGSSTAYIAAAPFELAANWKRGRWNGVRGAVNVELQHAGKTATRKFQIPSEDIGRFPIIHQVKAGEKQNWAVGELVYVRYGAALNGEAKVDGDLAEWGTAEKLWVPAGEKVQARWSQGVADYRTSEKECYTRWTFRAGEKGMYFACRAQGDVSRDSFTMYFDPRPAVELGSAGPYYWLDGSHSKDGKFRLQKGETSTQATGLNGVWKATESGAEIEGFVPYELMERDAWPQSGDLGLSIVWAHTGADQKVTRLMWSENGHPWNTRWYGVVRRIDAEAKAAALPYMVRVR